MNHLEPPHLPAGLRRALHCLSLLLLPALTPEGAQALTRPRPAPRDGADLHGPEPAPYLPAMGAPPLRFKEVAPPPDLVTRPAAGAPPTPALTLTESSVALANAAAARSATMNVVAPESAGATAATGPAATDDASVPAPKTPSSILPDDARPAVRPEDFLPYFQIPGSATRPGDVTLLVPAARAAPAPATLPASSATYTQTPR